MIRNKSFLYAWNLNSPNPGINECCWERQLLNSLYCVLNQSALPAGSLLLCSSPSLSMSASSPLFWECAVTETQEVLLYFHQLCLKCPKPLDFYSFGWVFCFSVGKLFVVVSVSLPFLLWYQVTLTKSNHWCVFRCITRGKSLSSNHCILFHHKLPGASDILPTLSSVDPFSAISVIC